jgi:hypothetical protein
LDTFGRFLVTFWHFWSLLVTFWSLFGHFLVTFWHFWTLLITFWSFLVTFGGFYPISSGVLKNVKKTKKTRKKRLFGQNLHFPPGNAQKKRSKSAVFRHFSRFLVIFWSFFGLFGVFLRFPRQKWGLFSISRGELRFLTLF